ncbi:MAG TPA: methylated-DNA--[protein]-cysteine S-methyltransferase, partial [Myxococcota bacterium]|nr:methylated-DNA--[protein]-cysteine S-methyltransferase [Myxococcota bacterium]
MATTGYALFDTAIGRCGIAWGTDGVVGVQLPEASASATRARIAKRFPQARESAPKGAARRAVDAIAALLRGEPADLAAVSLDLSGLALFDRRVYEAARAIPPGATLSYGEIARQLGDPAAARAVGRALARNPFAIVVPCHRVLAAGGRTGGFSAAGGVATKRRLLAIEAERASQPALFATADEPGFDRTKAVAHLRAADPALARLVERVGPCELERKRADSMFGALAEAIVHQQLSNKAAATIYGRVRALFPRAPGGPTARHLLRASDEALRGAGLSRGKILALRDLAEKELARAIPTLAEARTMEDEAIVERLVAVRGIGRWSAQMLLIFHLGRPDVFPADDFGLRKGYALA